MAITVYNGPHLDAQRVNQALPTSTLQMRQRHDLVPIWSRREGLCGARARYARRGRQGAQRGVTAQGPAQQARPKTCSPARCARCSRLQRPIRTSGSANFQQLQAELTISRTRLRHRGVSSTAQSRNTIPAFSASPPRFSPRRLDLRRRLLRLGDERATVGEAPAVKF